MSLYRIVFVVVFFNGRVNGRSADSSVHVLFGVAVKQTNGSPY